MKSADSVSSSWFWILFLLLTLANALVSLETLPSWLALGLVLVAVVPLGWLLYRMGSRNEGDTIPGNKKPIRKTGTLQPLFLPEQEILPGINSNWVWILLAAACFIRLWKFGNSFVWPTGDEALTGLLAIDWNRHWDGRVFYTAGQDPPTLFWLTGVFFRFIRDPGLNLWLPPALVSCLAAAAAYAAARKFFSRSFSFLAAGFWAFSYWPLQLGRTDLPACFTALWVPVTFYFLGGFLRGTGRTRVLRALAAGFTLGLNWLTFTSWPFFVLAAGVALAAGLGKEKKLRFPLSVSASLGFLLGILPFLLAAWHSGFGRHIADVAPGIGNFDPVRQTRVVLNYLSVLGWGAFSGDRLAAPLWGGFLNPLLASFFCLGLAEMAAAKKNPQVRWLALYGVLSLLPGMLSLNMNGDRIVQILPLLILVSAWGCASLLKRAPEAWRIWAALLLFLACLAWDEGRLGTLDPARDPAAMEAAGRSVARYRAYQVLQDLKQKEGPGVVLGEWDVPADRSLEVMTYYFNVLRGARSASPPAWLALLTDAHYLPFLKGRFPEGDWRVLDADLNPDKPRLLGILKIDDSNRDQLNHWAKADPGFTLLNWDLDHLHDRGLLNRFGQDVQNCGNWVQDDPFLAAVFWEKVGATYYYFGHHYPEHLSALENAVKYGYPAAHLYGELASLYWVGGNPKAAEEAALKAKASETKYPWR